MNDKKGGLSSTIGGGLVILGGEAVVSLITVAVFFLVGHFDYTVVTGVVLGSLVTVANYLVLAITVNRAIDRYMELRGDKATCAILPTAIPATEEDWDTEYNDFILSVRVVDTLDEAISHITRYTTGHSEAIITESMTAANRFRNEIDAAAVYVNASTRFTDGGEFGFGAEIGISTQKLHARGPMGLYALTTDKYLVDGDGQVR